MFCFGYRYIIADGVKSHAVIRGRNIVITELDSFTPLLLQPSLFHRLGRGPDFPIDKDLTEFYQQSQWMAKATKLKLPKQAQLSNGLQNVQDPMKADPDGSLQTRW